jgi:hypothetical protein
MIAKPRMILITVTRRRRRRRTTTTNPFYELCYKHSTETVHNTKNS